MTDTLGYVSTKRAIETAEEIIAFAKALRANTVAIEEWYGTIVLEYARSLIHRNVSF